MSKKIALLMGSQSDWPTMSAAADMLREFDVEFHAEVLSAHRTPQAMLHFAAEAETRGFEILIAGAGGAAHLPGMLASSTRLPVLGVPVQSKALNGLDSLLSIVQMPRGVAVASLAIGQSGAANAALMAVQILALSDRPLADRLNLWREKQTQKVLDNSRPGE